MLGSRGRSTLGKAYLRHTMQVFNLTHLIKLLVDLIPDGRERIQQAACLNSTEHSQVSIALFIKAFLNITGSRNILGSNNLSNLMNNTVDSKNITLVSVNRTVTIDTQAVRVSKTTDTQLTVKKIT